MSSDAPPAGASRDVEDEVTILNRSVDVCLVGEVTPVLVDPEDRLSPELGIYVLPTVMVLDRDGNVTYQQPGVSQAEALRRALYEAGVEHPATAT